MNKFFFTGFIAAFMMPAAFSQSDIRFENRKTTGYFNTTQVSMLMGNRKISERANYNYLGLYKLQVAPSVTMTNGVMLNENWAAGVGLGIEIFDQNLFPVFADIRYTVRDHNISPFFAIKMGHAYSDLKKKHHDDLYVDFAPYYANNAWLRHYGGFMMSTEMGVKFPLSENADLLFTAAYRHQKTRSVISQDFGQRNRWKHQTSMNRLSLGVAIMFR